MISFGGDWNPEQWPEKVWATDVGLMRRAGVTLVTVGVFSWARLAPTPRTYDFGWLDRVLDLLAAAGIGACLATPTASPPPWFTRDHPDAMPINRDGVRLTHGSRDTYCVNAPAYRFLSQRVATALGERYSDHPALRLWHVHNEYGTPCYCDHCAAAFRVWLADRYGDPFALNDAWSTDFWSQRYGGFNDVLPPRATQYLSNPAQLLDYRRFVSDAMLAHYLDQRSVLRGAPVTTNFVLGGWVPVDHARWAREVDVVAVDDYPAGIGDHLAHRAFTADLARGWARDRPWMVMEHEPGAVHGRPLGPGQATAAAMTYVERGATGVLYFQWRQSRGGAEQWHPAIVDSPAFEEFVALGRALADVDPPAVHARSALLYDEPTMWAWQSPHLPIALDYEAIVRRWHRHMPGPVDVLPVDAPLAGYDLVVAPALHLISAAGHGALRDFAAGGGTLVLTHGSGLVDENCRRTPGALDDLIGARLTGPGWPATLEPDGATVLLRSEDGRPQITEHHYGEGLVRYLATHL